MIRAPRLIGILAVLAAAVVTLSPCHRVALSSAEPPASSTPGPLSPQQELATFRLAPGFRAELVACEPDVVDPVALAFDQDGRMYVAEMIGYPNGGVATGDLTSGRIKLLEDRDGDGFYEHCTVFADGLRLPSGVQPWKGGLLVADAPSILYLEDTDGDGKADRRRTLYTGFSLVNSEQLINSLQWGLDNWVDGMAGNEGGTITSPEKKDMPALALRGRGVRFHPETPGSLEPTSGGGQYGLAADDWERWFTATNSQHLRHIVLPDHYLRRNPALPVSAVTLDIPDHGAACKVFRLSPFEAWRVERTRRRAGGPDAQRFPATELVPGGYVTSGTSPVVYTADLFPPEYRGNTFVCDPANNLVHRDVLVENGATFTAQRAETESDREFIASTDNWFRPVWLSVGPDGALYLLDFYREVIETPLSLPDDIKKTVNLESRGKGRIWRIVPQGAPRGKKPALGKATSEELAQHLADPNIWWRLTAQRLLVERQDKSVAPTLRRLATGARVAPGRAHALWTLQGLGVLDEGLIGQALQDQDPGVREQALRLADSRLRSSARLRAAAVALGNDPVPRVRFQLAFTLGEADGPDVVAALARVLRRDVADPWTQTAVLSSAARTAPALLEELAHDPDFTTNAGAAQLQALTHLGALVGARANDAELAGALGLLAQPTKGGAAAWQVAVLQGLGQGLQNSGRPLARLWEEPSPALSQAVAGARPFFEQAAAAARDEKRPLAERLEAARLLGYGPFAVAAGPLQELLAPQEPSELEMAAVRSLALQADPKVPGLLLAPWASYSPVLRREVLETLLARRDRVAALLTAVEEKKVLPNQIEPARLEQLRRLPDPELRKRARALLAGQGSPDRRKVIADYQPALEVKGDVERGRAVFKKTCSTCHRLENVGVEVGPDLLSALRNKSREQLLTDILDPSREVDPRYINYQVTDQAGRSFTGMIVAETASSITLRRAEKAEDTLLRSQIETIEATAKSLMPEGLEAQLSKQDVADVIAYLQAAAAPH
jgi:putative membrane-bound dehydrogenase-like protein